MNQDAQLVLRHDPSKVAALHRSRPTTIGRAADNRLRLASAEGVADHHAVVRYSLSHGWLVCDWQSRSGTFLEGMRLRQCRRLSDGDEIQLGPQGPVLVFRLLPAASERPATTGGSASPTGGPPVATGGRTPAADTGAAGEIGTGAAAGWGAAAPAAAPSPNPPLAPIAAAAIPPAAAGAGIQEPPAAAAASGSDRDRPSPTATRTPAAGAPLQFAGRSIPLEQIRSAHVRSRPRHPNSFSWWVLLCLGSMVLLPVPWLFWSLQIGALAAWIVLGSRKDHELVVTLRDGMAHRHRFSSRLTALSHRNGIRKAIGQSLANG